LNRFATGGRFKAILQNDAVHRGVSGKYNDKELQKLGMDLQEQLGKYDILVMRGDGKLTPYSMASTDMQFLETRKHIDADIARFFNVPLALLYADTSSNYNTQQQANLAFYTQTLQPILTDIEREFNAKLLSQTTYKNCKFQFDLSALNSLDPASKVQYNKGRLETGVATVNDLRKENDMPPVDGGDKTYVSVQVAQLGAENEEPGTANEEGGEQ
jgi:HK97 family phage portal protein